MLAYEQQRASRKADGTCFRVAEAVRAKERSSVQCTHVYLTGFSIAAVISVIEMDKQRLPIQDNQ